MQDSNEWNYDWEMKAKHKRPLNGLKAFGTFVCGGGSTMGYKLAGFDHLGGVEIDRRMAEIYKGNHKPKHFYEMDIRKFNEISDLPKELLELDILDGSPPCSTFSMAGQREDTWGKEKVFNEGQKKQVLDELVFVYCETIEILKPKVAILENVPGILAGKAKKYAIGICERLERAGYSVQIFQLNAATMGVPQARERVFFIARRKDLDFPELKLDFNQKPILFNEIICNDAMPQQPIPLSMQVRLPYLKPCEKTLKHADMRYRNLPAPSAFFGTLVLHDTLVAPTLTSSGWNYSFSQKRLLVDKEYIKMSTFPRDYNFMGQNVKYVCGMSVPPLMTANIANQIAKQWLLKEEN